MNPQVGVKPWTQGSAGKLMAVCCLLVAGCGPGEVVAPGDATSARALTVQTLDAWKAGKSPADLQAADPSLIVVDEDWRGGAKLTSYEILEEPQLNGSHFRVYALLTLQEDKPSAPRKVCYAVTPGSPASVLRSDFLD